MKLSRAENPVHNIIWVPINIIDANDYNPNSVAPQEMRSLKLSIQKYGLTMPIVVFPEGGRYVIVDGFHRFMVCADLGYTELPCSILDNSRAERISATVLHNKARGVHGIDSTSRLVAELLGTQSFEKTAKDLGMSPDELYRYTQKCGLRTVFALK